MSAGRVGGGMPWKVRVTYIQHPCKKTSGFPVGEGGGGGHDELHDLQ